MSVRQAETLGSMEFAIIETGGKQYRVRPGDELAVERLTGEIGDSISFERVLLLARDGETQIGRPVLESARVEAEIVDQLRAEKIMIFKKRRRKNSRSLNGHRQLLTRIRVRSIAG